jgi:hypothetical protein
MPADNIIPFRPRAAALTTCTLPEADDYTDESEEGDELPPMATPYRLDTYQSEVGGMVLVDALIPQWVVDRMMADLATI